jgi:hypothetical protein
MLTYLQADEFQWPDDPPEDWWLATGAALNLSPETIRFAAALFRLGGAEAKKNSVAAHLAGLSIGRTQAFRLARSVGVRRLLLEAEKVRDGSRSAVTEAEIDRRIDDMILSPEHSTSAKGIELRDKRAARKQPVEEVDPNEIYRRLIIEIPHAGPALAVGSYFNLTGRISGFPFVATVGPYLAKHFPDDWRRWRGTAPDPLIDSVEAGPILTPEQIIEAVKKPAGAKPNGRQHSPVEQQETPHAGA